MKKMKVLLLDIENRPNRLLNLTEDLTHYSNVIICYAQSDFKIPIDWIEPIAHAFSAGTLKIIKMPNAGKNAADFGIAFWAGMLAAQQPNDTHYDIISHDTDLDFVVDLLISQGRSAKRIAMIKQPPIQEIVEDKIKPIKPLQKYCIYLAKNDPRPAKSKSLINNIDRFFKETVNPNDVLTKLIKKGVVSINHGVVTYNNKRLLEQAQKI
jgi:hypothetical protein